MHPTTLRRLAAAALATGAVAAAGAGPASAAPGTSVAEGDSGTTSVAVTTHVPASLGPQLVAWATRDGTAADGEDYTGTAFSLFAVPAGATSATVSIPVTGDTRHEGDETFDVLFNTGLATDVQTVTILDDDPAPTVSIADVTARENDGAARFDVSLSAPSGLPVEFDWAAANGTAKGGSDFKRPASGHVTLAPGETHKTISVDLVDDAVHEDTESFALVTKNLVGATLGHVGTATILDDDPASQQPPAPQQPQASPQQQDNSTTGVVIAGPAVTNAWPRLAYRGLTRSGWVRLSATCPRGSECGGVITLRAGQRTVGKKAYSLDAGRRRVLAVRLTRAARRAIARHRRLRVVARTGGGPVLRFTVRRS
jgi:hypothetical protein